MKQTGYVTNIDKSGITVSVVRSTACGDSCASCSSKCELKNTSIVAQYKEDVKTGDKVVFEMPTGRVILAAFLVYIVPLILLLAGYIIFSACGADEGTAVLGGLGVAVLWFVCMHFADRKMKMYYKHIITEVIGENTDVRL